MNDTATLAVGRGATEDLNRRPQRSQRRGYQIWVLIDRDLRRVFVLVLVLDDEDDEDLVAAAPESLSEALRAGLLFNLFGVSGRSVLEQVTHNQVAHSTGTMPNGIPYVRNLVPVRQPTHSPDKTLINSHIRDGGEIGTQFVQPNDLKVGNIKGLTLS